MAQAIRHPRAAAVLPRATRRAAEQLDLPQRQLARVLGVSGATVAPWPCGSGPLAEGGRTWELAVAFVRLHRLLAAITGAMRAWLHAVSAALEAHPLCRARLRALAFHA